MTSPTIRFYFDYESPNAYLAWTQLPALAKQRGAVVEPVPVLYAGLLEAHGQLGPGEIPAKMFWMTKNITRKAKLAGVPLNPPAFLPFNPLLALRVSLLASERPEQNALIDALFDAVWVHGLHVSEPAIVERIATDVGLDGPSLVASAKDATVKERLRRETEAAVARGIFGVPSMTVGDEVFWGYDDFPHLEMFLDGEDPLDPAAWRKDAYRAPAASATRRQFRPGR